MTTSVRKVYLDGQELQIPVRPPNLVASPRCFHTGGMPARVSTDGTDATPSTTETYLAEIYVPENVTITGIALMNGSAAAGNVTVGLYDANGISLGKSASTAQSGTDSYQLVPLALTLVPGTYFVAAQFDSASARFNTHVFGSFAAGKITGTTYGTMGNVTLPTTFTTGLGPIASLY